MKKITLVAIFLAASSICFGVAQFCEYQETYDYGGAYSTSSYEYYAANGDCCNPSPGYGTVMWRTYYANGQQYGSDYSYSSNSELAAGNPACNEY